ncbi:hypothetical protein [Qipengyuania algicida]|nr:hypothetical protein [Qipengyuania algicida]
MRIAIALVSLSALMWAQYGQAQVPRDIVDLVGARAAGGETQLRARGYDYVRGQTGDDRVWTYWWNPRTQVCITVSTVEGRYEAITASPSPDCNQAQAQPATLPDGPVRPAPVPSDMAPAFDLGLICFGEGQRPQLATKYGYTWNEKEARYTYGNRTELTSQDFDASVSIQLFEGGGRIRLPKKLIPPLNSRGEDGWWKLDSVVTTRDTITAQYRLNGLNKPKLTIDRRSGRISIRGASNYGFTGTCDTVGNEQRRF